MAIWLTALKAIPWADVIAATPAVTQAARKLFKRAQATPLPEVIATPAASPQALVSPAHIQALEETVSQLLAQQQATAALIDSLAAQHSQVVTAVDRLRTRLRLVTGLLSGLLVLVVAGGLYVMLDR